MDCCKPKSEDQKQETCDRCGKSCDLEKTVYKIKHNGRIYCFDTDECKHEFQMREFGEILY